MNYAASLQILCTMGQGFEKIDLSPSESWDLFKNDQHKSGVNISLRAGTLAAEEF